MEKGNFIMSVTELRYRRTISMIVLFLCALIKTATSQNKNSLSYQESVVLHTATSETENNKILFKANLLQHNVSGDQGASKVLNVALVDTDGNTITIQYHKIIEGKVISALQIPKEVKKGHYYIEAYTQWMQNFPRSTYARQPLAYNTSMNNFPSQHNGKTLVNVEGGTLIEGVENKVVVRSSSFENNDNKNWGAIIDNKNNVVAKLQNYTNSIGMAFLTPSYGTKYSVVLHNQERLDLPEVADNGITLNVNNLDPYTTNIRVVAAKNSRTSAPVLQGYSNGILQFTQNLRFSTKLFVDIDLDKTKIPSGILELRIVNDNGEIEASRPLWIDKNALVISLYTQNKNSEDGHSIKVTDHYENPMVSNISLSAFIQEEDSVFTNTDLNDTPTNQKKNFFIKDLELLASYYDTNIPANQSFNPIYDIQHSLEFTGRVFNLENEILRNTPIQVMSISGKQPFIRELVSDDYGILALKNLEIEGNTDIIFRTEGKDTKERLVRFEKLERTEIDIIASKTLVTTAINSTLSLTKNNTEKEILKKEPRSFKFDKESMILDEVQISGRKAKRKKINPPIYGIEVPPSRVRFQDPDRPKEMAALLSQIAGVNVFMDPINPTVTIPSATGSILFVIDGIPLSQPQSFGSFSALSSGAGGNGATGLVSGTARTTGLADVISMVSPSDIERIEVLMNSDAAIFGSRGAGGVIVIYTRNGSEYETIARKEGAITVRGYESEVSFQDYIGSLSKRDRKKEPLLVWDTSIKTDRKGEATIKLPKIEGNKKFQSNVSAVTLTGEQGETKIVL